MENTFQGFNPVTFKRVLENILSRKYGCKIEVVLKKDYAINQEDKPA